MNDQRQRRSGMRPAFLALGLVLSVTLGALFLAAPQASQAAGRPRCFVPCRASAPVVCWVQPEEGPAPREAIQQLLDGQVTAWNRGDLEGFMAGYWQSPELTFFSGKDVTHGWQATLDRYRKRYQGEGREMGKLTFSKLDIEVLGPDSAVARGSWQVVKSKETVGGLFTLLLRKFPEGWRIVHDHTSG